MSGSGISERAAFNLAKAIGMAIVTADGVKSAKEFLLSIESSLAEADALPESESRLWIVKDIEHARQIVGRKIEEAERK